MKRTVVALVAIAATASITLVLLLLVDLDIGAGGGTSAHPVDIRAVDNLLLTDNRETLEVCVDTRALESSADGAVSQATAVETAVLAAAAHPYWSTKGLTAISSTARMDVGCPSGPPPPDGEPQSIFEVRGWRVEAPSRYRLFVFILSDDGLTQFAGSWGYQRAPQEKLCSGDVCREVTSALYVSESQLGNAAVLQSMVEDAIGLPGR
jgi:hypothetical protein